MRRLVTSMALGALGLIAASVVFAEAGFDLSWHVLGGGGGQSVGGGYRLAGTVGQAVQGSSSGAGRELISGFWADARGVPTAPSPSATPTSGTPPTITTTPGTGTATPTPTASRTASPTASPTEQGPLILVVNTTDDSYDAVCSAQHCSLREAIYLSGERRSEIRFAIAGTDRGCSPAGVCTIRPGSQLPPFQGADTVVDGYTQAGAHANTAPIGAPSTSSVRIVLDGSAAGQYANGLQIEAPRVVIRGLSVGGYYTGIEVRTGAEGSRIEGNHVGVGPDGTTSLANGCMGVHLAPHAEGLPGPGTVVVGGGPAARNVIGANGCAGIGIVSGGGHLVIGNYIGVDVAGNAMGNTTAGILIFGPSTDHRIGGPGGDQNVIAANDGDGITLYSSPGTVEQVTISRNRIFGNGGLAIRFYQPSNGGVLAPVITDVTVGGASGLACAGCLVEVFSDEESQAEVFEGWARAGADGRWTVPKPSRFTGRYLTATATDGSGNTSELSEPVLAAPVPTVTSSPGPSPTPTSTRTAEPAQLFIPRALQR